MCPFPEFNVGAMTKGVLHMICSNPKATREWPVWSLLPSENKKHERAVNVAIKDVSDRDSTSTVNVSADLFSGEDTLHNSNKISSNVLSLALANSSPRSLVPETENEKSQCGTAAVPETEGSEEAFTSTASRTYSSHKSNKNLRKVFHHLDMFCVLYIVTSTGLNAFMHVLCILIFSLQLHINTEPDKILLQNASRLAKNLTG